MYAEGVIFPYSINFLFDFYQGPDSYYGSKGLRKVTHESATSGKVSFQFSYAAGNNNGTSVEDGQIPEIMFYTWTRCPIVVVLKVEFNSEHLD